MKYFNNADIVMYHNRDTVIHGDKGYFGNSFDEIKNAVDKGLCRMVDEIKNDSALCFTTYDEDSRGYAMFIKQEYVHDAVTTEPFTSLKHLYHLISRSHDIDEHKQEYEYAMDLIGYVVSVRRKDTDMEQVFSIERFMLRSGNVYIGIGNCAYSLQELHDDFEIRLRGYQHYRPIGFYKYNDSLYFNDPSKYTDKELESLAYAKVIHLHCEG